MWIGAAGCGATAPPPEAVALDKVPEPVLKTARAHLPGYTFTRVYRKVENGKDVYELLGKDKQGKRQEVEVTPDGEFVAVE
jgi:hypothetical protein